MKRTKNATGPMAALAVLALASSAHAAITLSYSINGSVPAICNVGTDAQGAAGVACPSVTSGAVTITNFSGLTNFPGASTAQEFASTLAITNTGSSAATVVLWVSAQNFTAPTGTVTWANEQSFDGTTGTTTGIAVDCVDPSNSLAPPGTATFCSPPGTKLSNISQTITGASNANNTVQTTLSSLPAPYSLSTQVTLTIGAGAEMHFEDSQILTSSSQPPPPGPVVTGDTATIGFWHNQNGQAVINSFNGGSTATKLGNWLATNFTNLFGVANPYTGTTLAGLTNAQVATVYSNLWTPSGVTKNTYVQAFAVALACYATSTSLGANATTASFGFNSSAGGTCSKTFNIGGNGAAFGVPNNTTLTVLQILQAANANFSPSTGLFYGGDQNLTSELNNVLDGINSTGDIG